MKIFVIFLIRIKNIISKIKFPRLERTFDQQMTSIPGEYKQLNLSVKQLERFHRLENNLRIKYTSDPKCGEYFRNGNCSRGKDCTYNHTYRSNETLLKFNVELEKAPSTPGSDYLIIIAAFVIGVVTSAKRESQRDFLVVVITKEILQLYLSRQDSFMESDPYNVSRIRFIRDLFPSLKSLLILFQQEHNFNATQTKEIDGVVEKLNELCFAWQVDENDFFNHFVGVVCNKLTTDSPLISLSIVMGR